MQLPQHIIDIVGELFDEGMDDEDICLAAMAAWMAMNTGTDQDQSSRP